MCEKTQIESVTRAVNPYRDFNSFMLLAKNPDLRFIISNTTEAGIFFDSSCKFSDSPAASFPGKLTQLLFERFKNNLGGFVILACELIDNNGKELKSCVLKYAELWKLGGDFCRWIENENVFCNTLVDRIVTGFPAAEAENIFRELGYKDMLLDTAEPYHLWVIEGDFENELPLKKAGFNVIWTNNAAPYKKMKVRILNGSHTSLVFPSLLCSIETVGESLKDELLMKYLNVCLFDYILPVLGETQDNKNFANAVLERFANPYIRHLWKSISLNSVSKFSARVLPTVIDYMAENKALPKPLVFSLACLIEYYKSNDVNDDPNASAFIKENSISSILSNAELWGMDLSDMNVLINESIEIISRKGIREALRWSLF